MSGVVLEFPYTIACLRTTNRAPRDKSVDAYGRAAVDIPELDLAAFPECLRHRHASGDTLAVYRSDGVSLYLDSGGVVGDDRLVDLTRPWRNMLHRPRIVEQILGERRLREPDRVLGPRFRPDGWRIVSDDREEQLRRLTARISAILAVGPDGRLWIRREAPCLAVRPPGSIMPGAYFKETRAPRVEVSDIDFDDGPYHLAADLLAGCDLLFHPTEDAEARERAAALGKRVSFREVVEVAAPFPARDLSALSMAAWTRSARRHAGFAAYHARWAPYRFDWLSVSPLAPDRTYGPLFSDDGPKAESPPPEIAEAIETFERARLSGADGRGLLGPFRAVAAAFASSPGTVALSRRPDIAMLLSFHAMIAARAEKRTRAQAFDPADEAALGELR